MPTWIEICRQRSATAIPEDVSSAYFASISDLSRVATAALKSVNNEGSLRCLLASIAISKEEAALAEAILELEPEVLSDFKTWLESR
jgi:hypothetical protein